MRAVSQKSLFWGFIGLAFLIFPSAELPGAAKPPNYDENLGENYEPIQEQSDEEMMTDSLDDCMMSQIITEERDFVPVLKCQFYHPGIVTYSLPLFADIDGDGATEVVAALEHSPDGFAVIDPNNCEAEHIVDVGGDIMIKDGGPVLGDVDRDGYVDIFIEVDTKIQRWEYNPLTNEMAMVWETPEWVAIAERSHLDIWDINQDSIPEIIPNIGQMVNSITGEVYPGEIPLLHGQGKGVFAFSADADPGQAPQGQGNVELVYGTSIYRYDFINLEWVQVRSVPGFDWGFNANVSLADMDLDGDVDAVVTSWDWEGKAVIWDLQTTELLGGGTFDYPGAWGSRMNIANMDSDPYPEMVMTSRFKIFAVDDIVTTGGFGNVLWLDETSDESGHTQITSFDFDGNGTYEAIYRDETRLRIFSGMGTGVPTGGYPSGPRILLDSGDDELCRSYTGLEYPTIGDIDNDNEAEIVATCEVYVNIYESGSLPWGDASKVWNTQAFNVTNVNQDGTIPAVPVENYTIYNNFLAQVNTGPVSDTIFAAIPDGYVEFTAINNNCDGTVGFEIEVCNQGATSLPMGTPVAFYWSDPTVGTANLIYTSSLSEPLDIGNCIVLTSENFEAPEGEINVFAVINDDGQHPMPYVLDGAENGGSFPWTGINECDYTNNMTFSTIIVGSASETTITAEICEGASYTVDGNTYTEAGTYNYVVDNDGCPVEVTLELSVLTASTQVLEATICAGETYAFNGTDYSETGTYSASMQNSNGCDSTTTLQLTVLEPVETALSVTICDGEVYTYNNTEYSEAGVYEHTFNGENGCDSLVQVFVNVTPTIYEELEASICNGETYEFGDATYSTSGDYQYTFTAANGCDSTVLLSLNVLEVSTHSFMTSICEGEVFEYAGNEYTEEGAYELNLTTTAGCDSLIQFTLFVEEARQSAIEARICEGESYTFGDQVYTQAGTYEQAYVSELGCDSIVTLQLDIIPTYNTLIEQEICEGEEFVTNGHTYTQAGEYTQHHISSLGCDSMVTVKLKLLENSWSTNEIRLCEGESVVINGETVSASGVFFENLSNVYGCDSLVEYIVEVLPQQEIWTEDIFICKGESVRLQAFGASDYKWDYSPDLSCTDCQEPTATPVRTTRYRVTAEGCMGAEIEAYATVEVGELPELDAGPDEVILPGEALDLHATTPGNLIDDITWEQNHEVICDNCPEVTVYPEEDGAYIASILSEDGCIAQDTMNVQLRTNCITEDFFVPNMITPNGDGANDYFYIQAASAADFDVRWLRIYDRWGELIFQTNDLSKRWDGSFKGKALNPGVYVYYLEVYCPDNQPYQKFGNITLIK